ncbi:BTB/POZ and MATH domain-containing protein 3-like [Miscanthus floridulus]|uniref:BTB/POZ and MATH domain-containing protein 3-like n=1 Tax=Miscanthus floridulus TaxID=154761 RepID=UPI0034592A65
MPSPVQQQAAAVHLSNLTDAACVVHQFKINGYSATKSMARTDSLPSKRLAVGGYEREVHYTPSLVVDGGYWIAFRLVLLSAPRRNDVKAAFRCRLLYASSNSRQQRVYCVRDAAGMEGQMSHAFKQAKESSGWIPLRKRDYVEAARVIENDSFTAECTITVVTELPEPDTAKTNVVLPRLRPLSGLHSLHQSGDGSDDSGAGRAARLPEAQGQVC